MLWLLRYPAWYINFSIPIWDKFSDSKYSHFFSNAYQNFELPEYMIEISIIERVLMNKKIISIQDTNRKEHFLYFKNIGYPYVGLTVNLDITHFLQNLKATGNPFYLSFLYRVVNAANAIPEFRRRIENDGIVEYDYCKASNVILKNDNSFAYCTLDCSKPFSVFLTEGRESIERAKDKGNIQENDDVESLFFISCIPWVSYTSITQAVPFPPDSNPRFTWGKYMQQNNQTLIPVSVLAHHALIDGFHISQFFIKLESLLAA
jgi:chloramphenicol O-acetyltransferase type A